MEVQVNYNLCEEQYFLRVVLFLERLAESLIMRAVIPREAK